MKSQRIVILCIASALAAFLLSSCSPRVTDTTNTPDAEGIIQTAIAQVTQDFLQTLVAFQTATKPLEPTATRTTMPTAIPTIARSPQPELTPSQTGECNRVAAEYRLMSPSQMTPSCNLVKASPKPGAWSIMALANGRAYMLWFSFPATRWVPNKLST